MNYVKDVFERRVKDIETYFELVEKIEVALGAGNARLKTDNSYYQIKAEQQKMIYASVYLHLYNLIESTITTLIEAVERHAQTGINGQLALLTKKMQALYVKSVIEADSTASEEKRLEKALSLFEQALNLKPFEIKIPPGGGGNWDLMRIEEMSRKIGVPLKTPRDLKDRLARPYRNDQGAFFYIKSIRNQLAHGSLSFVECGEALVARDLNVLIEDVKAYLKFLIDSYERFLVTHQYKI
ncbi:hypothetical protein PAEH1_01355 [Paenalcaligenes hominis]|uniref:MAE-28990/MAE-18760-like HEPN domain-containing protein n=1 Tax=Paenalcaligenes hominis TaxID=643674 RepID=A0A1U9JXS9_9BURK|nr:MAE_28990/MAE_18760 family HEPN-like nuclease [Paenalcaligenes hominis]AQS50529.1 hypothetical protein PAEH1_01355 [Paenalcaligenes hominis]